MFTQNLPLIAFIVHSLGTAESDILFEQNCRRENNVKVICNFIPESIPKGISNVVLDFKLDSDTALNQSYFVSSDWNTIKRLELRVAPVGTYGTLYLQDNCFSRLKQLQVLRLHVTCGLVLLSETFYGLGNVNILDMSGSIRFHINELVPALNRSDKLPRLTKLVLSNCSLLRDDRVVVDDRFIEVLQSKKISHLDVSGLEVAEVNLTALFKRLKYLEVMNASYISFGNFIHTELEQDDIKHIKSVDVSYADLRKKVLILPPGKLTVSNAIINLSDIKRYNNIMLFLSPVTLNISGISPHLTSVWIRNCTVKIDQNPQLFTKELIIRQNNIRRLDSKIICEEFYFSSFERFDISENELEFLHPDILSCMPNLQKINLSKNQLIKMARESNTVFENMFSRLKFLKNINLSSNDLITIPFKMFRSNSEIEVIDFSSNKLDQVHFTLTGLRTLKVINLRGNNIHTLDTLSINNLKSVRHENVTVDPQGTVILKSNPLSCSKCETQPFISWLLSTKLCNVTAQTLVCSNEKGVSEHVNENTLYKVEKICERQRNIIIASVSAGVLVLLSSVVFLVVYIKRKHASKVQNRVNVINLLRKGEGYYEFAVFLAYSNDDEDFVNTYILHSLNENLQLITGIDRELVCTGDRHFRPGFYVHNEAYKCLDTASVMIVVASDNFCQSAFCRNELDQAFVKRKPIVLMFIEHIDPEVMIPTMKELYQKNVRILWTVENGEYKMKTTWENVCLSILDLIH